MALFAQQIAYQPVAWQALIKNPHNRLDAVREVVGRLGGRVVDGWFTLGDFDALVICELPDEVTAAAFAMAVGAGGAIRVVKTTPLIPMTASVEAMRRAAEAAYTPPASEIPYFGVYRPSDGSA